jgi:hypothetical protein
MSLSPSKPAGALRRAFFVAPRPGGRRESVRARRCGGVLRAHWRAIRSNRRAGCIRDNRRSRREGATNWPLVVQSFNSCAKNIRYLLRTQLSLLSETSRRESAARHGGVRERTRLTRQPDCSAQDGGTFRILTSPNMLPMLRGTFFSIGLFIALWGVSLLFVDKLVVNVADDTARTPGFRGMLANQQQKQRVIDPPDWVSFSLLSVGAVTMLYAVALPRKV